jgi:hypothetical protein
MSPGCASLMTRCSCSPSRGSTSRGQHYAFLVDDETFDGVLAPLCERQIASQADPRGRLPNVINTITAVALVLRRPKRASTSRRSSAHTTMRPPPEDSRPTDTDERLPRRASRGAHAFPSTRGTERWRQRVRTHGLARVTTPRSPHALFVTPKHQLRCQQVGRRLGCSRLRTGPAGPSVGARTEP